MKTIILTLLLAFAVTLQARSCSTYVGLDTVCLTHDSLHIKLSVFSVENNHNEFVVCEEYNLPISAIQKPKLVVAEKPQNRLMLIAKILGVLLFAFILKLN